MSAPLETYREWYRKKMRADSISFHDTLVLYLAAHDTFLNWSHVPYPAALVFSLPEHPLLAFLADEKLTEEQKR